MGEYDEGELAAEAAEAEEKKYITKDSGERESHQSGAVRDVRKGKGRYDLFSPYALKRIAGVFERGAEKYNDRNWEKGMPYSRFLDSALRHTFQYLEGKRDEDHLAQAAWNLMAIMHMEETRPELDDMPGYDKGESVEIKKPYPHFCFTLPPWKFDPCPIMTKAAIAERDAAKANRNLYEDDYGTGCERDKLDD